MRVAFTENSVSLIDDVAETGEGVAVFSSADEMAAAMLTRDMDSARRKILEGAPIQDSTSPTQAADLLWAACLAMLEPPAEGAKMLRITETKKDAMGNRAVKPPEDWELVVLSYVAGADHMADFFRSKLPGQAKTILQILERDGRGIWTNDEISRLAQDNAALLGGRQDPRRLWKYYRTDLESKKIIRRMTFVEAARLRISY